MKSKKKISFIIIVINIELFGFILLGGFFFTMFEPKTTISEFEKRELTPFPSFSFVKLMDGNYTDKSRRVRFAFLYIASRIDLSVSAGLRIFIA